MHHFFDWIKLGIVQILVEQVPNQPGTKYFLHEEEEGVKVKHEEHANKPMKAKACAGRRVVTGKAIFFCCVLEVLKI